MHLRRCLSIVFVFVVLVVENSKGQLFEGEACMLENNVHGLCKTSENCPEISTTIENRRQPKICSFNQTQPIFCCPYTPNHQPYNPENIPTTTNISEDIRVSGTTPLNTGDACTLNNGAQGECKRLQGCPRVRNMMLNGNQRNVKTCRFLGTTHIVCCPINNSTLSTSSQNRRTLRPIIRTTAVPPSVSAVGSKSASMCDYFSQFVYQMQVSATLYLYPEYYNESQCNSREFKANQNPLRNVEEALYREFPHLASLGYGNENNIRWLCTGSLISERFVLTTAHCLRSPRNGKVRWVMVGDLTPTLTTPDSLPPYIVSEWIPHESYRESSPTQHDIALIKLERDVKNSGRSRPACLYTQEGNPPRYKFAMAVGWGRTDWDDTTITERLMKKDLTFVAEDNCSTSNQVSTESNSSMICVSDPYPEESSCVGDLGGPIQIVLEAPYCMQAIVGLTSYGERACANATSHAVYTRVSDYISWIENHVWP